MVESPERIRELLGEGSAHAAERFRAALAALPSSARDAWVDAVFGLEVVADEPTLPRGCTPYYPCSVDVLLRTIEVARITAKDVFVDIGSGIGRALIVTHLLTGAEAIGLEIQRGLVERARAIARTFALSRVTTLEGDAAEQLPSGSVYFLYSPFSGPRLERVFLQLEELAKTRPISVCCVQLPTVRRKWLELASPENDELVLYRSVPQS
jgi:SAM-dependent methyltransferase